MAKSPDKPKSRKEERPGAADARQGGAPASPATPEALADLLNPAINKGTAGLGSGTGLDAAAGQFLGPAAGFLRRAQGAQVEQGISRKRRRRSSTGPPVSGLDPQLAEELGLSDDLKYRLPRADLPKPGSGLASMGVAATPAVAGALAARGPPGICRHPVDAAPPAAAGEIRRRHHAQDRLRLRAARRPAAGDQGTGRRRATPRPHAGAARRHRLGQDLHHGQGDRGDAAPGADPGAQQDAGRAALRRVQVVLPRQRGGIFRLLLRLLPAGSLRPAHRHLYREGILHQRADRPHAPQRHARAARARRRHHRRLGVLHLRHRLGGNLFGDDLHAQAGRQDRPAPAHRRPGGAAIQAHAGRFLPRLVPRARRHRRNLPGALRGPRLARAPVRRRDREDRGVRPAHRAQDRRAGIRQGLRQFALRHAAPDADPGHRRHQARIARPPRRAQRAPAACWKRSGSSSAPCSIWK